MTAVETIFLDTNVLLASTDPSRTMHTRARAVFQEWPQRGVTLVLSGQVLREYLVVATRPIENNGLALTTEEALANVASFETRAVTLDEGVEVRRLLRRLVKQHQVHGKRIHDANIVATMLARGVRQLLTENVGDFPFPDVEVVPLGQADTPEAPPDAE